MPGFYENKPLPSKGRDWRLIPTLLLPREGLIVRKNFPFIILTLQNKIKICRNIL
jgi:hypothetical protein